jgi:hypothetical protein
MYTFGNVVGVGKWAVEQFSLWLSEQGYDVRDVQDDEYFRQLDVDLQVSGADWPRPKLVEVKGDRYPARNVYLEKVSNTNTGSPGCIMYTCAEYLAYYFVKEGRALIIPVDALRGWIESGRMEEYPEKRVGTAGSGGKTELFSSRGHTVPVEVIVDEVGASWIEGLPVMGRKN